MNERDMIVGGRIEARLDKLTEDVAELKGRLSDHLKALEEKAAGPPPASITPTGETVTRAYRIDRAHLAALETWAKSKGLTVTEALHRLIETGMGLDRDAG